MLVISAGKNEIFDFALPMGVGLVDMAINLTKFLQKRLYMGADEKSMNLKNIDLTTLQRSRLNLQTHQTQSCKI